MLYLHILQTKKRIIIFALLLVLSAFIIYLLLPPTTKAINQSALVVEQQAYYQLEINGKPTFFFTNYTPTKLIGGAMQADSVRPRKTRTHAYWVNSLSLPFTCFGRVVTKWSNRPSTILSFSSFALHQLIANELKRTDDELADLQTQYNELSYYMRVHNVQDYGYNTVAAYHWHIQRQRDSLQTVINALENIPRKAHLRVKQINRYIALYGKHNSKRIMCNRIAIYTADSSLLLQTQTKSTPHNESAVLSVEMAKTKLLHWSNTSINQPLQKGMPYKQGYYVGETKNSVPNGYGQHHGNNGSFYDGHWLNGKPDGFGFYIAPHEYLQVGEWKDGMFKGERMNHNSERIYGIDLSKHQHEKGTKHYSIEWAKLRITDLGKISTKQITGQVNYPIAFVYIKSTEGRTVLNPYYRNDYLQAHKHGIRVGTYHFFSTTSSGTEQARYFLQHSLFTKGDLPAVLDVEPSDEQIAKMGGPAVMFQHIRNWLKTVYSATKIRPILYISQMFTKRYLPMAIDIQGEYSVWIARYGEYKPELKLTYWQLSPDGKVRGIHGDVDINVFNGYRNQYETFLQKHSFSSTPTQKP